MCRMPHHISNPNGCVASSGPVEVSTSADVKGTSPKLGRLRPVLSPEIILVWHNLGENRDPKTCAL